MRRSNRTVIIDEEIDIPESILDGIVPAPPPPPDRIEILPVGLGVSIFILRNDTLEIFRNGYKLFREEYNLRDSDFYPPEVLDYFVRENLNCFKRLRWQLVVKQLEADVYTLDRCTYSLTMDEATECIKELCVKLEAGKYRKLEVQVQFMDGFTHGIQKTISSEFDDYEDNAHVIVLSDIISFREYKSALPSETAYYNELTDRLKHLKLDLWQRKK